MIVAPSGTGKSSLVDAVLKKDKNLKLSISYTTRPPRSGELHGREYFFLCKKEFFKRCQAGEFLEWARVHDHYYGTSRIWIEQEIQSKKKDIILEIDWQGAKKIKQIVPQSICIFIFPPSFEILEFRLRKRKKDDECTILKRLTAAKEEIKYATEADYWIINDVFKACLHKLYQIILVNRLRTHYQFTHCKKLIKDFEIFPI